MQPASVSYWGYNSRQCKRCLEPMVVTHLEPDGSRGLYMCQGNIEPGLPCNNVEEHSGLPETMGTICTYVSVEKPKPGTAGPASGVVISYTARQRAVSIPQPTTDKVTMPLKSESSAQSVSASSHKRKRHHKDEEESSESSDAKVERLIRQSRRGKGRRALEEAAEAAVDQLVEDSRLDALTKAVAKGLKLADAIVEALLEMFELKPDSEEDDSEESYLPDDDDEEEETEVEDDDDEEDADESEESDE